MATHTLDPITQAIEESKNKISDPITDAINKSLSDNTKYLNPQLEPLRDEFQIKTPYDIGLISGQIQSEVRAQRQPSLIKAGSMVARGVVKAALNTVEPFGHILDFEEHYNAINGYERDYSNWFNDFITKTKEDVAEALPIYTEKEQPDIFTSDWFFKNFDEAIASIGYFVPGSVISKGLGLGIKGIGAATNLTKVIPKAVQGTASIGGPVGAAIAQNYSEHVLSAVQTLELNTKKYVDSGMSPEEAKKLASQDAEQLIEDGKWNLLLQIPEYLMLFRGSKWTRSFSKEAATASIGKKVLGITGVAGMEYLEEANTGFFEKEAARYADVKTGKIKEGDDGTKSNRYFDHLASYEGLTEGLIGAFGGAGMKTVSTILDSRNKTSARNQVRENEAFAGNLENFKNINTQSFYDLAQKNAHAGTYESFLETLNIFANTTQEQATQLGFDKDYKTKASQYIKDAEFFEDEYNKLKDSYTKNPIFAQELLYQKINERLATQQILDISTKISQVQGEISSLRNAEKVGFDLSKLKDNVLEFQGLDKELKSAIKERKELSDKAKEQRTVTYNETLGELDSRIKLLTEKQSEVSSDIEKQTKEYLKNNTDKKIENIQKFLTDLSTKEFELIVHQQFKESALSRVKNARKIYNELTSTKPEDLDKIEKELIAKQTKPKVEKEAKEETQAETQTTEVPSEPSSTEETVTVADQNEVKTLATDQIVIDENPEVIDFTRSIEDYFDLEKGKKKVSMYTQEGGKDNMSEESSNRLYRFNSKNSPVGLQALLVTRKSNPKLYEEILELDIVAKEFEDAYFKENKTHYNGIWMVTIKNGKPVLADKNGNISDKGKMVVNTITSPSAIENGRIKVTNSKDRQEIAKAKAEAIVEITKFRNAVLASETSVILNYTDKSKGHAITEPTIGGKRQPHSIIGRLAGTLTEIELTLPTVSIIDRPGKAKLKNGQIADVGKLYAINKNGNIVDLIPRLINSAEQERVFNLILKRLKVLSTTPSDPQNLSEELNKLIYFGIPKGETTDYTLGISLGTSALTMGKSIVDVRTPEGQERIKEFLKTKRVNVNTRYGFEDQFTDIFGTKHDSYQSYLLDNNGSPLFGTDLVSNKEIQFKNQYFTYDPSIKDKTLIEPKTEVKLPENLKWKELDRLKVLATTKTTLTKEETDWFKSNFPNIPIEIVKGLIENKSFGRFLSAGKILLSDEASYGTLYHESFHVVSQMYLTPRERQDLYRETKERTKAKTDLEAEETLAEDFIHYKKTGRILGGAYKRNDLFRKILNFLKDFLSLKVSSIEDIYRRIDKGFYKNKPTTQSAQFKSLNRSKVSEDKGVAFEAEALSSINALFYNELFKGNKTPSELNIGLTSEIRKNIYKKIYDRSNELNQEFEEADEKDKLKIINQKENLKYIFDNFSSIFETFREKSKSQDIIIEDITDTSDNEDKISVNEEENVQSNDNAYQEANLKSAKSSMNDEVWTLITSLKQYNKDGTLKLSELTGLPQSINPSKIYNFLLKQLAGLSTYEEIYEKIDKLADKHVDLIDLSIALGGPSMTISINQFLLQMNFRQDFGKNRMTSHKTILKADGTVYTVDANNENNAGRIKEKWQNNIINSGNETTEGKIILDLDKIIFSEPETFLKSIGLTLSPETILQAKEEDKFIPAVTALQNYIKKNKGDITTLFAPTPEEKEKKTDVAGNIQYLTQLEADFNPESAELSFMSTEGKTVYSVGYNNALSIVKNIINNSKTKAELFERLPHLNTVSTESSIYLNELFDKNGNKRKDRVLEINLHDGLATDAENETDSYKASTRKLSAGDKWVQEINSLLLDGRSSYIRASDKSSEHTIYMNKYGKGQKLFIPIEDLITLDNQKLKDTFQGYFVSELKRVVLHRILDIGADIDIFNTAGAKFTVFEGILSAETKRIINETIEALKTENLSQEELLAEIDKLAPNLQEVVSKDVITFFEKYVEEIKGDISENKISKGQGISTEFKQSLDNLINAVAVNDFINSAEQTKLFIADMAFYKDLFKRTASMTGTKQTAANSQIVNDWLNNNFTRLDNKIENGEIHVAVFEDVNQSLQEEILNEYINVLVDSGISKAKAEAILVPYLSMDEGDAQGWITLDEYRSFITRLGKSIPNNIFEKAQKGKLLNADEMHYFTVIKAQYAGPQKYNTIFAPAYHKYSLLPLLPSMVKGKNMEQILNHMTKNEIGYAMFKSGSKVGTRVANGKANSFYTADNHGVINTKDWQKQTIYYDFLGLQTETNEPKTSVIFGTQFRKLLFSNQFAEGKEHVIGSQKLQDGYNSIIDKLVQQEKNNLIKELGINPVKNKNGEIEYPIDNKDGIKNLIKLLQDEAKDRNLADNLIDGLQSELIEGKLLLKYKFDAMVTKNKIDSMIMSLVNTRLIRQKIHGDALIQVASSGMEQTGKRKVGTNEALLGYRQDENGKTLAAQVMIPISMKDASHALLIEQYGSLDKLNKAIKDGKVDKDALQLVAYRIPTQGFNSMEFFEIAEFLPEESSTSIIVPTTIVAKSGSDFDVDKLNVIKRSRGNSDKVTLSNRLMDIAIEILSHKDNFTALITPNSSAILKNVTNEIKFIEHLNKNPDAELLRDKFDTEEAYQTAYNEKKDKYTKAVAETLKSNIRYTNQLKLSGKEGKIAQFIKFMTAKDMIGIGAIQNTHNVLAQTHNLTIDSKQAIINLVTNRVENDNISISKQKDSEGRHNISEIISQILTASVDAAKDPFMFDINLTMETLSTALYLVRTGVPFETVGYFLKQPIITEYLQETAINKSGFLKAADKVEYKKNLILRVKKKFGNQITTDSKIFSENDLKFNLNKINQNTKQFNPEQGQILNDYIEYQEQSQKLSDAIRATNMDTAGIGKNLNTIQAKLDLIQKVKDEGFVKGIEDVLEKSIIKTFNQLEFTQKAFGQFYYTQTTEFIKVKQELIAKINPFGETNRDKLATLIENDLINFIVQNYGYPNIVTLRSKLFRTEPIARKLLNLKNKPDIDKTKEERLLWGNAEYTNPDGTVTLARPMNLLLKELQPLLATKKRLDNNIRMYTKRLDTFQSNQLTEAFRELKELDPSLAKEIMDLGILQSGLNNSPITFLGVIPFEYYNDLVKTAFENYEKDKKNGVSLSQFENLFLRNNKFNPLVKQTAKKLSKLGNDMYGKIYTPQKPESAEDIEDIEELPEESIPTQTEQTSEEIYSQLGNKTQSGNVVIKSVYQQGGIQYAKSIGGVFSMRVNNNNTNFGNPFSSVPAEITKGLIATKSTKESVEKYIDWVINSQDERAKWIREQLQSGILKGKSIVYYKELGEPSHATALDYLINKYNWTQVGQQEIQFKKQRGTIEEQLLASKTVHKHNGKLFINKHKYGEALNVIGPINKETPGLIEVSKEPYFGEGGREVYTVKINPQLEIQLSKTTSGNIVQETVFREIIDKALLKYEKKFKYILADPKELLAKAEELGQDIQAAGLTEDNIEGFYDTDGTLWFNKEKLTSELAFHEFSHPFIDIVTEQNKPLFSNLKRQLQDTESGKVIIAEVKKEYKYLVKNGELTEKGWKEAIVTSLGRMAENQLNESKDKGLIAALKQLLKRIGEYLQSLISDPSKVIKPIEIRANTTLEELAAMFGLENKIDLETKGAEVSYNLKSIEFLSTPKATQLFDRFFKTNKEKFYQEITQFISKNQLALIKDIVDNENPQTIGDLFTSLLANYSYTVEINTAESKIRGREDIFESEGWEYTYSDSKNNEGLITRNYYKDSPQGKEEKISSEEYWKAYTDYQNKEIHPTNYYAGLTVPGGTNYTENEISTPLITPSIKGHAQFSTDQGIGWHRADNREINFEQMEKSGLIKKVPC